LTSSGIKQSCARNKEIMDLVNFAETMTDAAITNAPIPCDINTHALRARDNL
jgi:hypothetical protein